jgi:O-succinylbenzoate synthase
MAIPVRGTRFREATLVQGPSGWGESSPLTGYPVSSHSCDAAAIEAAVLGLPDPVRASVPVNALIPQQDLDAAVRHATDAVAAGYRTLKLKVGDDGAVARVAAVRAAVGDRIALRLDANGRWDVPTARRRVQEFAPYAPEFIEEPVRGLADLARLRNDVTVPIAADESVRSRDDVHLLAELRAVDVLVLKVQACGGAVRALRWAEDAGVPVVVTSMLETSVGLAAGLGLAAALPQLPYACGLGTAGLLGGDVVDEPLIPVGGELEVRRPQPAEDLLERYAVAVPK